jgi:ribose transport system substrate-binding protein
MTTGMRYRVLLIAGAALLLGGCLNDKKPETPSEAEGGKSGAAAPAKRYKIGFAQANSQDPWRQVQNASLQAAAAKHPEIELKIQDARQDSAAQISQIDTFVTDKTDLLLVSANEAAPLTPKVGEVFDKKIPVLLMERGINSDKYTALIGGDNVQIGRMAGQYLVKTLKSKGNYVEIKGVADATPTKDRSGGFHEAVDKEAGLKLADSFVCNYKRDEAIKYVENLIQSKKPFDAIYAHNDEMALGAMIALKNAGVDPKTKIIIGIDGVQAEAIEAVEKGEMSATFKYPWLGEEAIQTALDVLGGKSVPKKITPDTEMVTKENAQDYLKRLPKSK